MLVRCSWQQMTEKLAYITTLPTLPSTTQSFPSIKKNQKGFYCGVTQKNVRTITHKEEKNKISRRIGMTMIDIHLLC